MTTRDETDALTAYALFEREPIDTMDYIRNEMTKEGQKLLYEMVTTPNPNSDKKLNDMIAEYMRSLKLGLT